MNSRRKTGFTLLELLVVISIIAILAVSLTPAFSRAREAARRTTCGQNLGQIHKAITMYETDYSQYPTIGVGNLGYTTQPQDALNLLYRQYVDDPRVFICASQQPKPDLTNVSVSTAAGYAGKLHSSYGYSPGHTSINSRVIVLADKPGGGNNSDNHGKNAGQNILSAGGSVSFMPAPPNNGKPTNDLGKDDNDTAITDTDIFNWNGAATYPDWDSGCAWQ